jgi:tetratricopeptide (TPR) repeat protein
MVPGNGKSSVFLGILGLLILALLSLLAGLSWSAEDAPAPTASRKTPAVEWKSNVEEGYRQLAAGDNAAALRSFEAALRLNPRAAAAKTGKGAVLSRQGKLVEAERLLKDALMLNPDPGRTHYELGLIYQKREDYQQAVAEFKQGIEKYRENHR